MQPCCNAACCSLHGRAAEPPALRATRTSCQAQPPCCAAPGGAGRVATRPRSKPLHCLKRRNPGVKVKCRVHGFQWLPGATDHADCREAPSPMSCRSTGPGWPCSPSGATAFWTWSRNVRCTRRWTSSAPLDLNAGRVAGKLNALPALPTPRGCFLWNKIHL
jgi:hypothetical protein